MGQFYDSASIYDWSGTYDGGRAVPIGPPSRSLELHARYVAPAADEELVRGLVRRGMPQQLELAGELRHASVWQRQSLERWHAATAHVRDAHLRFEAAAARERLVRSRWNAVRPNDRNTRLALDLAALRFGQLVRAPWRDAAARQAVTTLAWAALLARHRALSAPWRDAAASNAYVRIVWRPGAPYQSGYTVPLPGDPDPPPGSTIIIPPAAVYFMIPVLTIVRTSDSADLNAIDATVGLDAGGLAWTLNATIPKASLPLVDPNSNSDPVLVQVNINGYIGNFVIESYSDNRKFGGNGVKIVGRTRSALLGDPYAPLSTFTNTTGKDASQLATDLMPVGWTLTWSTQDWLVPAGIFTYADLSPIAALAQLASAVGGVVFPDLADQALTVQPAYPISPWDWPTSTPFADVPAGFWLTADGQWEGNFKADYNGIYVSGQNSGVIGRIKRTGTAGNNLLPTVTDALIVHVDAARERGRNELAKANRRKSETIRTPLLPAPAGVGNPGIFLPGQLLQIHEDAGTWLGQVMSVQVNAGRSSTALSVRQTIVVERHA